MQVDMSMFGLGTLPFSSPRVFIDAGLGAEPEFMFIRVKRVKIYIQRVKIIKFKINY